MDRKRSGRTAAMLAAAGLLAAAGCATWRSAESRAPSSAAVEADIPEAPEERRRSALFDADLGPDTVDVSAYPALQQRNYAVYARACSQCHTLARSINAPHVSRRWWDFYVSKMRVRAMLRRESLDERDLGAVLDFLEYDANARKVERAAEFERLRQTLKRRFRAALDKRIEELQNTPQPILSR